MSASIYRRQANKFDPGNVVRSKSRTRWGPKGTKFRVVNIYHHDKKTPIYTYRLNNRGQIDQRLDHTYAKWRPEQIELVHKDWNEWLGRAKRNDIVAWVTKDFHGLQYHIGTVVRTHDDKNFTTVIRLEPSNTMVAVPARILTKPKMVWLDTMQEVKTTK